VSAIKSNTVPQRRKIQEVKQMNRTYRKSLAYAAMAMCSIAGLAATSRAAPKPSEHHPLPPPVTHPAPEAEALGISESVVKYCKRVDAPAAAKLETYVDKMVLGVTKATLDKVRDSKEYQQGNRLLEAYVETFEHKNAAQPCKEALAAAG
jgi:hypothetical protein